MLLIEMGEHRLEETNMACISVSIFVTFFDRHTELSKLALLWTYGKEKEIKMSKKRCKKKIKK